MTPKNKTAIVPFSAISILLLTISPVLAQQNQTQSQEATFAIQMAQAAKSYADNVVSIGQQRGLNVSQAQALVGQGNQLLSQAQSELGTNSTLALRDALGAMRDYHAAVQSVVSQAEAFFQQENEADMIARAKQIVGSLQNRTALMQSVLAKECSTPGASNGTCADGRSNLNAASSDLSQVVTILSSPNPDLYRVKGLVTDAVQHLQAAAQDINQLAQQDKAQMAIQYIQNNLEPKIPLLQQYAQKANLTSSVMQQVQADLSSAQSDFSSAIQAFQSGSFAAGMQDAQQGVQLLQQAYTLIQQNARP
jgi:hypothetical protein